MFAVQDIIIYTPFQYLLKEISQLPAIAFAIVLAAGGLVGGVASSALISFWRRSKPRYALSKPDVLIGRVFFVVGIIGGGAASILIATKCF